MFMSPITKILHVVVKSLQKLPSNMSNCDRTLQRQNSYKKVYPTQLANSKGEDEFICKVAKTTEEPGN